MARWAFCDFIWAKGGRQPSFIDTQLRQLEQPITKAQPKPKAAPVDEEALLLLRGLLLPDDAGFEDDIETLYMEMCLNFECLCRFQGQIKGLCCVKL